MKETDCRKLSRDAQEALRKRVVLAIVKDHMKTVDAVKIFKVSRAAIIKWLSLYRKQGMVALNKRRQGRPLTGGKLKGWQAAVIVKLITDKTPDQLKFPFALWTRESVQHLIKDRFNISFSFSSVGRLLRKWGFSPQKPLHRAMERNPTRVAHWIRISYPQISKRAQKEKAEIHWGDEMGIRSDHHAGRTYGRIGQTPVILQTGKRFKCNMISTVTNKGKMRFMVFEESFTVEVFIKFLRKLVYKAPKKIFLIVDNHKVHRARKTNQWLNKHKDKIEIFFLPPYSPELNPDELLNQDTKSNATKHHRPETSNQLKGILINYLKKTQKLPQKIMNFFKKEELRYIWC